MPVSSIWSFIYILCIQSIFLLVQSLLVLVISVCPFILLLGKSINQSIISPVFQQIVDSPSVILVFHTGSSCRNCHLRYILIISIKPAYSRKLLKGNKICSTVSAFFCVVPII